MKTVTLVDTDWATFEIEANWAQAASPVWLDGQVTQYQVASFRHDVNEAIETLVLEPEEIGWDEVKVIEAIRLDEDEEEKLRGLVQRLYDMDAEWALDTAEELDEALEAAPWRDLVTTRRALDKLLEIASDSELNGNKARSIRAAARKLQCYSAV